MWLKFNLLLSPYSLRRVYVVNRFGRCPFLAFRSGNCEEKKLQKKQNWVSLLKPWVFYMISNFLMGIKKPKPYFHKSLNQNFQLFNSWKLARISIVKFRIIKIFVNLKIKIRHLCFTRSLTHNQLAASCWIGNDKRCWYEWRYCC